MKFMIKTLVIATTFISFISMNNVSFAQEMPLQSQMQGQQLIPCGPHNEIVEKLKNKYKEVTAAIGIAKDGRFFQLFASKTGSWTILLTHTNKTSCMMLAGTGFDIVNNMEDLDIPVGYIR